jgi:hypothetical protein
VGLVGIAVGPVEGLSPGERHEQGGFGSSWVLFCWVW